MSDHLADEIEQMNTRWMPLVAERLWLCSQADSQVALRRRVTVMHSPTQSNLTICLTHSHRILRGIISVEGIDSGGLVTRLASVSNFKQTL